MSNDVADALDTASEIADLGSTGSGPIGIALKIASLALKAGAKIARAGRDPVFEIQRILSVIPEVAKIDDEFDDYIDRSFRRKTDPSGLSSPASDRSPESLEKRETDPAMPAVTMEDIYEDEDDDDTK